MTEMSNIVKNNDNYELYQTIQLSSQELIKLKGNDCFYDNIQINLQFSSI